MPDIERTPLHGRCPHCAATLPNPWTKECRHRRACEARVMMADGVAVEDAAAHAQRLPDWYDPDA